MQVAEGSALSVVACVLWRQLSQKSKFCFVLGMKKGLRGEAVSILCYHRNRAAAKGRAQWFTHVAGQTLESRTGRFLGEQRVLNMDSGVLLPFHEKCHLPCSSEIPCSAMRLLQELVKWLKGNVSKFNSKHRVTVKQIYMNV